MHSPVSGGTGMSAPSLSDGATSSWRALSPDHLQHQQQHAAAAQQQHQQQHQQQQQGPGSAAMSPLQPSAAAAQQHAAAGSAGVSPTRPLGLPSHDDTIVYSALSRPLPDYALTHVFSQVGPGRIIMALSASQPASQRAGRKRRRGRGSTMPACTKCL